MHRLACLGWAAASVLAALAGCAGPDAGAQTGLGGDGGAWGTLLRGTVLNEELAPVAGAVATVAGAAPATTGEDGLFEIAGLAVGTHTVTVQALGYFGAQKDVTVVVDAPVEVDFNLVRAPSTEPYTEVLTYVGYEVCSLVLGVLVYGPPTIPCTEDPDATFLVNVTESWRYLVVEMDWKTQDSMWLILVPEGGTCNTGADNWCWNRLGTGPLRIEGAAGDVDDARRYALDGQTPLPEGAFPLEVTATYGGMFRDEVNGTFGDACNAAIMAGLGPLGQQWNPNLGCGLGYGYSSGIRMNYYASLFHHEAPLAPEAYTALPDE